MSGQVSQVAPSRETADGSIGGLVDLIDDDAVEEAVGHLRALIRIDTTNPPGNEIATARYLEDVLKSEGLEPEVLESEPGRGNLVVRLKATAPEPGAGPLLLTSHMDVVPAETDRWSQPPFSGLVKDGFIWGRGTLDMKGMTAMSLAAILALKRHGVALRRDVILAAVADEEMGGEKGMGWMVTNHPDLLRAEYALNEVGGFTLWVAGRRFYPIQVAEKGVAWLKLRAQADPGHGAIPRTECAVGAVAEAVAKLVSQQPPVTVSRPQKVFLEALAAEVPLPAGVILKLASQPWLADKLVPVLFPDPDRAAAFLATMRNTANPTGLKAGGKTNVVPSTAEALIDGRVLPGSSTAELIKQMKTIIGPVSKRLSVEVEREMPPTTVSADTEMFRVIAETVARHDPGGIAVPYLIPGYTDAVWLSRLGVKTYGFSPVWLSPDVPFSKLFHGHDERVPLDGFAWGVRCLFDVVGQMAAVRD